MPPDAAPDALGDFAQISAGHATLRFPTGLYDLESVQHAAHRFADRCGVLLDTEGTGTLVVRLSAKNAMLNLRAAAQDFANEVLDQHLRSRLRDATEPVRRVILAHAFSGVLRTDEQAPSPPTPPLEA